MTKRDEILAQVGRGYWSDDRYRALVGAVTMRTRNRHYAACVRPFGTGASSAEEYVTWDPGSVCWHGVPVDQYFAQLHNSPTIPPYTVIWHGSPPAEQCRYASVDQWLRAWDPHIVMRPTPAATYLLATARPLQFRESPPSSAHTFTDRFVLYDPNVENLLHLRVRRYLLPTAPGATYYDLWYVFENNAGTPVVVVYFLTSHTGTVPVIYDAAEFAGTMLADLMTPSAWSMHFEIQAQQFRPATGMTTFTARYKGSERVAGWSREFEIWETFQSVPGSASHSFVIVGTAAAALPPVNEELIREFTIHNPAPRRIHTHGET